MNPDDYTKVHAGEDEKLNKHLHEVFDKFAEAQPELAKGMVELFESGVLEDPQVQEKMGEIWNSESWMEVE